MNDVSDWLQAYQRSHLNPVNRVVNWICVPQSVFAIWLGLKCIPIGNDALNVATVAAVGAWLYYLKLSRPLALGMLAVLAVLYTGVLAVEDISGAYAPWLALAIFAEAWTSQLIGRHVEGERSPLLKDLWFLLIGPLWLLADVYRWLNWPLLSAGNKPTTA